MSPGLPHTGMQHGCHDGLGTWPARLSCSCLSRRPQPRVLGLSSSPVPAALSPCPCLWPMKHLSWPLGLYPSLPRSSPSWIRQPLSGLGACSGHSSSISKDPPRPTATAGVSTLHLGYCPELRAPHPATSGLPLRGCVSWTCLVLTPRAHQTLWPSATSRTFPSPTPLCSPWFPESPSPHPSSLEALPMPPLQPPPKVQQQ